MTKKLFGFTKYALIHLPEELINNKLYSKAEGKMLNEIKDLKAHTNVPFTHVKI